MKRVVVIDGKSVFYRGYYAMGALSTSDGTPTGGVYGFAAIAMELVRRFRPEKVVVAWDKAGTSTSQRKAIYQDYKAGRVKPPEDFFAQIPLVKELVEALGWAFVECDDYEADDIIGTLAFQVMHSASLEDIEMIIISSDLDMLQVVSENVKMVRLLKGFSEMEEIDVPAIEAKYGIRKEQFLDLKALKGDSSDNIPGVPGIGEKGAVKLLNQFGTVEGVYEHLDEISGATRKKLEAGRESAMMSYKLAKIMTDAPVKLEEIPEVRFEAERVGEVLDKLEFRSLKKKFLGSFSGAITANDSLSEPAFRQPVVTGDGRLGPRPWPADTPTKEHSPRRPENELNLSRLKKDFDRMIVSYDVKGEMHRDEGVRGKVLSGGEFYDLGQGAFLLNPLMKKAEGAQEELFGPERAELEEEYRRQRREFEKYPKLYRVLTELDFPMVPVLFKIEERGMKIDREHFSKLEGEYREIVDGLAEEIQDLAGWTFKLNSPIQLSEVLFEKLNLPVKGIKKTSRGYSTGAKELEKLKGEHPIIEKILEYREAAKLLTTYIVPLPTLADERGRIHTTFTQNVTATGRLSSVNPNLQNIPTRTAEGKKIREGFVAEEGKVLISADYAQFELRLAAELAGDEKLIEDFNSGTDIHTKTAAEVYKIPMGEVTKEQRRLAKVVNFGIIYGMSAKGLADATGMSLIEAKEFVEHYMELRKPIGDKMKAYLEQARGEGFVETYFGRRRPTPDVKSANFIVRTGAERAAQNMPIQGTEADLMKKAMIRLDSELPEGAEMVMQVHDSIMVEARPELAEEVRRKMKEVMEGIAPEFKVRLVVDVKQGKNWGEV